MKSKVYLEAQKTVSSQEQKEQCWRYTVSHFKLHYIAIAIKTAWHCPKSRYEE
jgi:hypothetical protein